jgi:hypothetical protein
MTIKKRKGQFFSGFFMLLIIVIRSFIWLFHKSAYFYIFPKCRYVVAPVLYSTVHVMWTISAKFRFVEPRAKMTAKLNA